MRPIEIPIKTVSIREQSAYMRLLKPEFHCWTERRPAGSFLICRGRLRPTPINNIYDVRVEYRTGRRPRVIVESPRLRRRDPKERIPHTFADDRPCLHKHDFQPDMLIANTIIPWLGMWLFFYESWRVTGEWQGGGAEAAENEDNYRTGVA